MYAQVKINYRQ